ncbi:MAG: AAA family ATPase [Thermodesulfovibrionales bacterium]|nr:AAA family ATPase [Thermodesulfovibrionales bacterium]
MKFALNPEELYRRCPLEIFDFQTTEDIDILKDSIGQERALKALDFGLSLNSPGFNIFALGENGTGRMRSIKMLLDEIAKAEPVPNDWCYVYNFKDPDNPIAISLPAGKGKEFQKDIGILIKTIKEELVRAFESKEYDKQRSKIIEEFQQKQKAFFSSLEEEAQSKGFAIRKAVSGLLIIPIKRTGEPLSEEEYASLDEATKKRIEEIGKSLQEKLDDVARALREAEKLLKEMLNRLEKQIALEAIGTRIEDLIKKYEENEKITSYLSALQEDILSHLEDFKTQEEPPSPLPFMKMPKPELTFTKYSVNLIVDNSNTKGAPVVFESNPTYLNLFGRIEYKVQFGIAVTDFSMIKAGSLHKANGGYIVIQGIDLFKNLFSYDALKRAIKNKEIKIEDVWEQYRLLSTVTMKPEAIPLDIKVILVGSPYMYYILYNLDEEFRELFKVKADFDSRMDRNDENIKKYASFIATCQKEEGLQPLDKSAVARVIEYSSRLCGHQDKLSTRFSEILDLLRESNYWSIKKGSKKISEEHILTALDEKVYRSNKIEERIREMMVEDTLIVDTEGSKVGQVNGLAVLDLGDYSFGKPSRITARTFTGKAGVVNIERETKMSGRIHEKAIMIISSYLGSKYAINKPLSLSASITFEQLYEMVEGDSATCAELYALLSSLSGVPLRQDIAVTGSMDQHGDVQPIGGVNEKIEGFFELCKVRGLKGQGVIIPRRNVKHLMLKEEVVNAVKEGKFFIYSINKMEEGLEILTGIPAGEMREDGSYPEGTINYLVMKRLSEISEALEKKKDKEEEKEKRRENDS